jgi:hypothetical protein
MATTYKVRFSTGPKLGAGEKYCRWDEDVNGSVEFDESTITLRGKRKTSAAVSIATLGPFQPMTKMLLAKDQTEVIPIKDLVRVVIRGGGTGISKTLAVFRLYQRRDDGTIAVHSFLTGMWKGDATPDVTIPAIAAVLPPEIITWESMNPGIVPPAALAASAGVGSGAAAGVTSGAASGAEAVAEAGAAAGIPADWYPDPCGAHQMRYWDGATWTAHCADDGQQVEDPVPS